MHGLINRSIQSFLRDTYGPDLWQRVARTAGLEFENFETMLVYDDALTEAVLESAANLLSRPRASMLEDLGTYLVSHPHLEPLRRLLRFGGISFLDFLHSLDELPGRSHLAVPDLDLPQMELTEQGNDVFVLSCTGGPAGFCDVMIGVLRAMADDYGALVLLDSAEASEGGDCCGQIAIHLLDQAFAQGRRFDLAIGSERI